MHNQLRKVIKTRLFFAFLFVLSSLTSVLLAVPQSANAATFSMQTGYYTGTGVAGKVVSGLGFRPDLVIIKASNQTSVSYFKTSAMPTGNTAYFNATTADSTTNAITLNSDGFTLGAGFTNTVNIHFMWTAFAGSDCTSSGTFCVGTYNGTNVDDRDITTGFQPGIVVNKRSTASAPHFRTASMPANQTDYFTSLANDTTGGLIKSFSSNAFRVGLTDNTSTGVYNFFAFSSGSSVAAEGSYIGDGTDNRNITGLSIKPDLLFVKNDNSATDTSRRAVMSTNQHNGDLASFPADTLADLPNYIQQLNTDGFQVGTSAGVNETGMTMYWFGLSGVPPQPTGSGTYKMATGTFTGTGAAQTISGVGFEPDLVLIKDNATNLMMFRTSMMAGDTTAYLGSATNNVAGAITTLTSDGFSVGTSGIVNTSGSIYQWQAFGNAYRPDTKKGAADFAVGQYFSGGTDNTNIAGVPFQMDYVVVKRLSGGAGTFRSSEQTGDTSSSLSTIADAPNQIQSITPTGFQIGTAASVASVNNLYRWFGFKNSESFKVGSYTGNATDDTAIASVGFKPDLVWIKQSTAVAAISKPATLAGDNSQYFVGTSNSTGKVKSLTTNGFTLGTGAEVNANAGIYKYAAWKIPGSASIGVVSSDIVDSSGNPVITPSFAMNNSSVPFSCTEVSGTLGTTGQRIRVSNSSSSATWSTSIAATAGATALWRNAGDTKQYDYNESSGSPVGCADGPDVDSVAGKLRIEPSTGTITPQSGCTAANIALGTNLNFDQSTTSAITLMSASSGAATNCYWDLTGVNLRQYLPANQSNDSYNLNFTVTTVAS